MKTPREPQPRVLVRPNRNTLGLAAVLVAMWYAGASQSNGAAYLLCFVLASVAAVSTIHAWANLRGVRVKADAVAPAFAGEELSVPLAISAEHGGLAMKLDAGTPANAVDVRAVAPGHVWRVAVRSAAVRRGRFEEVRIRAASLYPLGFFTARLALAVRAPHYIYPAPEGAAPLPRSLAPSRHRREGLRAEGDDFAGTRTWLPGESQRHIDWKAAARGQPLLTKQWAGDSDETLVLDWSALPQLGPEARLRQLARWVVLAERGGASYGLSIPGMQLPPSRGDTHYHACLRALAVFEIA